GAALGRGRLGGGGAAAVRGGSAGARRLHALDGAGRRGGVPGRAAGAGDPAAGPGRGLRGPELRVDPGVPQVRARARARARERPPDAQQARLPPRRPRGGARAADRGRAWAGQDRGRVLDRAGSGLAGRHARARDRDRWRDPARRTRGDASRTAGVAAAYAAAALRRPGRPPGRRRRTARDCVTAPVVASVRAWRTTTTPATAATPTITMSTHRRPASAMSARCGGRWR